MISEKHIKKYCSEDPKFIENYDLAAADLTQVWDCHHRAEMLPCGKFSVDDLKKFGLYWNRPANELIFLPHSLHYSQHLQGNSYTKGASPWNKGMRGVQIAWNKGIPCSSETKKKISTAKAGKKLSQSHKDAISRSIRGENHPNYGKHLSDITKCKLSVSRSKCNKGRVWCNNGSDEKFVPQSDVPDGWMLGRIYKHRNRRTND